MTLLEPVRIEIISSYFVQALSKKKRTRKYDVAATCPLMHTKYTQTLPFTYNQSGEPLPPPPLIYTCYKGYWLNYYYFMS